MIHSKTEKALVTLGTLAVFLYVEIKSGSFGNSVFDQIQNHILSGISSITEQIEDTVEVIFHKNSTLNDSVLQCNLLTT